LNDLPPPPQPASLLPSRWPWLLGVIPLGVGAFLGYESAYESTLGGFSGIGAAFIAMGIGAMVVITLMIGVANALRPAGRGRVASRYAFAAAGLLAAGGVGGGAVVRAFDLGYHAPVVLEARGEASIVLDGIPAFEPRASGRADCQSVADRKNVQRVVALSLGTLNGGSLRADVSLQVPGVSRAFLSLFIDAEDLPETSFPPMWQSLEPMILSSSDGTTGSLSFGGAAIRVDPVMGAPAGTWPATLAGELSWACDQWFAPDAPPPATVTATGSLSLLQCRLGRGPRQRGEVPIRGRRLGTGLRERSGRPAARPSDERHSRSGG